jgi:stress response protein YsnF
MQTLAAQAQEVKVKLAVKDKEDQVAVKVKEDQVVKAGQTGKMAAVITRIAIMLAAARLQPNSLLEYCENNGIAPK